MAVRKMKQKENKKCYELNTNEFRKSRIRRKHEKQIDRKSSSSQLRIILF